MKIDDSIQALNSYKNTNHMRIQRKINEFVESMNLYRHQHTTEKFTFDRSFQVCPFCILISNVDLSDRIRTKMTFINVPHNLPMRTNEGSTPFPVTGDSFINLVLNQFTPINGMRRFHQSKQLCFCIINIVLDWDYRIALDQTGTQYLHMENDIVWNQ
jgi:hypothetical protein